jgi:hypothetical protein
MPNLEESSHIHIYIYIYKERERAHFVVFMKGALDFELAVDCLEVVGPTFHNFGDFIELAIIKQLLVVHQLLLRQQLQS